jgi:hypothetical protein
MKISLLAFLFLSTISVRSYGQTETGTIHFNVTEVDYGVIKKGSNGIRQFIVTNVGNYPLIINSCNATCGCTVPNCPQDPIPPGKSAVINVRYNTDRIGVFAKNVTVYSNDQKNPVTIIKIKGEVIDIPVPSN